MRDKILLLIAAYLCKLVNPESSKEDVISTVTKDLQSISGVLKQVDKSEL